MILYTGSSACLIEFVCYIVGEYMDQYQDVGMGLMGEAWYIRWKVLGESIEMRGCDGNGAKGGQISF